MAKQPKGELVVVVGFNYEVLEAKVAEQARSSAERILWVAVVAQRLGFAEDETLT